MISLALRTVFPFRWNDFRIIRVIFLIYAFGFLYGTWNHIVDIWRDGFLGYHDVPFLVNLYWTSLTFLDPLAVILLFTLPLHGVLLSVLIMASDLAVNLSVALYFYWQGGAFFDDRLILQMAFGCFVFLTAPFIWKKFKSSSTRIP